MPADPIQTVREKETLIRLLTRILDGTQGSYEEALSYLAHLGYTPGTDRWEFVRDSAPTDKEWTP